MSSPCTAPTWPQEPVLSAPPSAVGFEALYEAWFDQVTRWVRALGGPDADLDDLVQDVFVIVYRRLPHFDGANTAGWLYQIARHRVRDFRRLSWFKNLILGRSVLTESATSTATGPAEHLERKQRSELLDRMLDSLNEDQRAAFVLFEIEGLSGEQIAELQGVPLNTVWGRIHKARKKLREQLTRHEQGGKREAAR